jgi:hypothetical protein
MRRRIAGHRGNVHTLKQTRADDFSVNTEMLKNATSEAYK